MVPKLVGEAHNCTDTSNHTPWTATTWVLLAVTVTLALTLLIAFFVFIGIKATRDRRVIV